MKYLTKIPTRDQLHMIHKEIDKLLWEEWDPIGVNDIANITDEYQCYTPEIVKLKMNAADKESIARHLLKIEMETMGLPGDIDNCRKVAEKIFAPGF